MKKVLIIAALLFSANTWCAETRDELMDKQREFVGIIALKEACKKDIEGCGLTASDTPPNYMRYRTNQGVTIDVVCHVENAWASRDEEFPHSIATRWGELDLHQGLPDCVKLISQEEVEQEREARRIEQATCIEKARRKFLSRLGLTKLSSFALIGGHETRYGKSYQVDAVGDCQLPLFDRYEVTHDPNCPDSDVPLYAKGEGAWSVIEFLKDQHSKENAEGIMDAWEGSQQEWQDLQKWYENEHLGTKS